MMLTSSAVVGCGGGAASFAAPLRRIDTATGHCFTVSRSLSWAQIRHRVTAFGLDEVRLPLRTTRAQITSVALKGRTGRLTIAKAAAVPGQAIGDGFAWGDPSGVIYPAELRDGRPIPGAIVAFRPRRPGYPLHYDGMIWKIVLGLTPGPRGGGAERLELRYRIGSHTYTFVGNARVGMYPTGAGCDRFLHVQGK